MKAIIDMGTGVLGTATICVGRITKMGGNGTIPTLAHGKRLTRATETIAICFLRGRTLHKGQNLRYQGHQKETCIIYGGLSLTIPTLELEAIKQESHIHIMACLLEP